MHFNYVVYAIVEDSSKTVEIDKIYRKIQKKIVNY